MIKYNITYCTQSVIKVAGLKMEYVVRLKLGLTSIVISQNENGNVKKRLYRHFIFLIA